MHFVHQKVIPLEFGFPERLLMSSFVLLNMVDFLQFFLFLKRLESLFEVLVVTLRESLSLDKMFTPDGLEHQCGGVLVVNTVLIVLVLVILPAILTLFLELIEHYLIGFSTFYCVPGVLFILI